MWGRASGAEAVEVVAGDFRSLREVQGEWKSLLLLQAMKERLQWRERNCFLLMRRNSLQLLAMRLKMSGRSTWRGPLSRSVVAPTACSLLCPWICKERGKKRGFFFKIFKIFNLIANAEKVEGVDFYFLLLFVCFRRSWLLDFRK